MKKILILLALLPAIIFASGNELYKVKSGYYIMDSKSSYGNSVTTVYFDDYGSKLRSETTGNGMIMTIIINGNISYTLNHSNKTYTEDLDTDDSDNIATLEDYKEYGEVIGKENILGKPCDIIKTIDEDNTTMKTWIWNNITLKQEISSPEMQGKMVSEVTTLELNKKIPKSKFEVPSNYKKMEINWDGLFDDSSAPTEDTLKSLENLFQE